MPEDPEDHEMKHAAKRLLMKFGLTIHRSGEVPRKSGARTFSSTACSMIELMGAPGSGKTTLLKSVEGRLREHWYLDDCLGQISYDRSRPCDNSEIRARLLKAEFRRVQRDITSVSEQVLSLKHRCDAMNSDILMMGGDFEKRFCISEGFCHNFINSIIALHETDRDDARKILMGRAFVVLIARSPGIIESRILKRRKSHHGYAYDSLTGEKLIASIEAANRLRMKFAEIADDLGCPVLSLSAGDSIAANGRKLIAFCDKMTALQE